MRDPNTEPIFPRWLNPLDWFDRLLVLWGKYWPYVLIAVIIYSVVWHQIHHAGYTPCSLNQDNC